MIDLNQENRKETKVQLITGNLKETQQNKRFSSSKVWLGWLLAACLAFLIQAYTIDVLPSIQQDEAQITDYGRLALDPKSDWSVTWLLNDNKALLMWSYLGPIISEIGYQFLGKDGTGSRIIALFGGLLAATMAFGWLRSHKLPLNAAFILSFAFMLDPLFVLSQRMARVDSWVISCCLSACWLLSAARLVPLNKGRWLIAAAGGLSVTALFIWPSAVFLFPLILFELSQYILSTKRTGNIKRSISLTSIYYVSGGVIILFILLLPIWKNILILFSDVKEMTSLNIKATIPIQDRLLALLDIDLWMKLAKAFVKTLSPVFPIVALLSLAYKQNIGLIVAAALTLALIFATLVYEFRALYLIPYFLSLTGNIYRRSKERSLGPIRSTISKVVLMTLLLWTVSISLFARTYLGIDKNDKTQREKLYDTTRTTIGPGKYKVFLAYTYEFYYAGRNLGWEMYIPYIQFTYDKAGNWLRVNEFQPKERFISLLSKMDYVIFPQSSINDSIRYDLVNSGFNLESTLIIDNIDSNQESNHFRNRNQEIIFWFLQGKKNFGPYLLFKRSSLQK